MPDVVVGEAFDVAEPHRQDGLGAIQRLNLALFIDREHDGVVGRVQVEADHIAHFFDEERVGGEFEIFAAMRLQREKLKDAMDRGLGYAVRLCCQPNAPVGCSRGILLEGAAQQNGNLFVGDRARPTGAKLIIKALETMLDEPLPLLAHRRLGPVQTLGNLGVGDFFSSP